VSSPAIRTLLDAIRESNGELLSEIEGVLPVIRPHGEAATLDWINACRTLSDFERDAGRAFVRGSREAEKVSESVLPWTRQALSIMRWRHSSPAVEGFMRNLPRAFGSLGHAGEERWANIGLTWCARSIECGCAYFATPVLDVAGRGGGIAAIEALNTPAEELYESRKLQLATFLPGAIRVRNLLGVQAVLPWAMRGADIMQSGRTRGEAYFRLESEESLALLLENMQGYKLADRNRLLGILLEVWLGEGLELKESTWSPEKGRPFMEIDGESLYFPAVMGNREEAIISVLHAAGHMRHGTFDRTAMKQMFTDAKAEFPEDGPVSWSPIFARYGEDAMRFQLIFDMCEDLRIESRLQKQIPNYFQRLISNAEAARTRHPDSAEYYDLGIATARDALRASRGEPVLDARFAPLFEAGATLADAHRIACEIYAVAEQDASLPPVRDPEAFTAAFLPGRGPNSTRVAHPQDNPDENSQTQPGQQEENQPDEQGEDESESPQESETGDEQDGGEKQETAGYGDTSGAAKRAESRPDGTQQGRGPADKGIPYPEWDYRESRYKKNWSWVQEKRLGESNLSETQRLMKQYSNALKRLKKAIQSQKPTRMAPRVKQLDGDDMDLNAVIEFVAEKISGRSPVPTIYRRREQNQREISVILLADMSTSIMQHLPEGGGRLVDRIRAGVLLFAESMEEVGDNYAIAGFCSKYRDNVSYYNIKDFGESYNEDVRSQIGGLSGRLATRMGAAIRHATKHFERVESRRRLLLLLSDGRPEDYDDGGDRRYLHEDTRMAVKEAVAKGVHPFCITVDTMANQYLPQIFGAGHYLVLDQINSLPNKLPEIYLKLRK
jgi:nitric oxide reductase NorD protein